MSSTSNTPGLSELTVTCHQCGGASMVRLDRKEYRCTHCGAITVISDDDADRLEQTLAKLLNRPGTQSRATPQNVNRAVGVLALGVFATIFAFAFFASLSTHHHSSRYITTYPANDSVPASQITLSPLQWVPDSAWGGNYVGMLYNHSGYTIEAPTYDMTLFHNGMKGGTAIFSGTLSRLQPGEYEHISFRVLADKPDRYEIESPHAINRSRDDIAPVKLLNPQFVHVQDSQRYNLIGVVQNTFTRPLSGVAQLLLYDRDQQVIGVAEDTFSEIRPGEKTIIALDAWTPKKDTPIASYEYLIDATFTDSR